MKKKSCLKGNKLRSWPYCVLTQWWSACPSYLGPTWKLLALLQTLSMFFKFIFSNDIQLKFDYNQTMEEARLTNEVATKE